MYVHVAHGLTTWLSFLFSLFVLKNYPTFTLKRFRMLWITQFVSDQPGNTVTVNCVPFLLNTVFIFSYCWFFSFNSSCAHPPLPSQVVLWDVRMLWRLFLEVLVFFYATAVGAGTGIVPSCSVRCGGGIWGGLRGFENCEIWSHCIDRREATEDCVSWLPGSKFSLGSLTHKFHEQHSLCRQSRGI